LIKLKYRNTGDFDSPIYSFGELKLAKVFVDVPLADLYWPGAMKIATVNRVNCWEAQRWVISSQVPNVVCFELKPVKWQTRVGEGSETRGRAKAVMPPRAPDSLLRGNEIVRSADIISCLMKRQRPKIKSFGDNN
jgi:hypothetical protein